MISVAPKAATMMTAMRPGIPSLRRPATRMRMHTLPAATRTPATVG